MYVVLKLNTLKLPSITESNYPDRKHNDRKIRLFFNEIYIYILKFMKVDSIYFFIYLFSIDFEFLKIILSIID